MAFEQLRRYFSFINAFDVRIRGHEREMQMEQTKRLMYVGKLRNVGFSDPSLNS